MFVGLKLSKNRAVYQFRLIFFLAAVLLIDLIGLQNKPKIYKGVGYKWNTDTELWHKAEKISIRTRFVQLPQHARQYFCYPSPNFLMILWTWGTMSWPVSTSS